MRKIALLITLFSCIYINAALAERLSKVELIDGSIVVGEISGVANGIYTINSQEMGMLQINKTRIKQISFVNEQENQNPRQNQYDKASSDNIESIKNRMLGDKDTMKLIMSLQNDPQFQEILNDPEIMNAIKSGNTASLVNNEKIMRLKENPTIQEIKERTEQENHRN